MTGRTTTAKIEGQTYEIPEIWLAGITRARSDRPALTIHEAIIFWHEQAQLEKVWQSQQKVAR